MKQLSVVIVNYNVKFFVQLCLDSLSKALDGVDYEVFVVDNASSDGSVEYLSRMFPSVKLIANKDNVGFARANNQAIRQCEGKYILLLNPDTVVTRRAMTGCLDFLEKNKKAGAVTVKMLSGKGLFQKESKRSFPTVASSFYKLSGLSSMFPKSKVFGKYNLLYLSQDEIHPVDVFCGAFIMFRKELVERCGLLDEDYFMYGEDIDFSYRLMKGTGMQNYYLPFPIIHFKGESTKKSSMKYTKAFYGAMLIFYRKHYGSSGLLLSWMIKTGVFFHGIFSFLKENVKSLFSKKGEVENLNNGAYTCVGFSNEERAKFYGFCRRKGIDEKIISFVGTGVSEIDLLPSHSKNYCFSVDGCSFDDIVMLLDSNPGLISAHFYFGESDVMV